MQSTEESRHIAGAGFDEVEDVNGQVVVFTLGHSTHTSADIVSLLLRHRIAAVADVRSVPYSRRAPQHNRDVLREVLRKSGIAYAFLGTMLGARPDDPAVYREVRQTNRTVKMVDWFRLTERDYFARGLEMVISAAGKRRLALLCTEEDPARCHRGALIAPLLEEKGLSVLHIRGDGRLETHGQCERRLIELYLGRVGFDRALAGFEDEVKAAGREAAWRRLAWKETSEVWQ